MPTLRDASSAQGVVSEGEARSLGAMSRPLSRGERVVDGWVNAIGRWVKALLELKGETIEYALAT
jgi:hypothetical protein